MKPVQYMRGLARKNQSLKMFAIGKSQNCMEPIVVCIKAALFTLYFEAKNQTNVGAVGSTFYCLSSNALKIKTNVEMFCPRLR